ncbi:MAG: NADH:flavin oxidoreductase [Oscillospiraceae bacterium]|nr:NADH:flavin oxidoreductase [Oscillospiraceae bacterium]
MLLKQPISIKGHTIHNRLVLPPMASKTSGDCGYVSDEMLHYYKEICDGGYIGLVITEHAYICVNGKASHGQLSLAEDGVIPGLTKLADLLHSCGSKAICQINHAGSGTNPDVTGGLMPVAPSAVGHPKRPDHLCRAMTVEEIEELPKLFADAARRAMAAGFDGVEIHGCHGYLLNQFYSPLTNFRTDAYGGSLENRIRIIRKCIVAVREAIGIDAILAVRLGGSDYEEGGATIEDAVEACKCFVADGANLIDLSGGMCTFSIPGRNYAGFFSDMTEAVKSVVGVPVILTGGVWSAEKAEGLLQKGAADLIGVGRAMLKNPRWAEEQMQ